MPMRNGNKLFNALSYLGSCFQTANTAGDWNATTQQINMEAAQSIQKEALQNINTINEYTYQIEQTSLYRKAYATEELLGSLSDEQIRLVDIVIQEEELRDATQLMNLSNRIMGVDPLYLKPYDGSAGWEARSNLVKQLREANPQKTDAELAALLDEMVELCKNQRNAEQQEKNEEELKQYATDHPLGAFALARSSNLIGGFTGLAELYFQRDNKYGYDTNAAGFRFTKNAAVLDSTVQDTHDLKIPVPGKKKEESSSTEKDEQGNSVDLFDFAYNVGAGAIDNGLRIAIGGGNPYGAGAVMFSQVTTSSLIEGKEKGYSDEKALGMAIGSAGFEALAEKMSWDRILKGGKGFLGNMTNGFLAEGAEGVSAKWMNRGMNQAVNGEYSELSKAYQEALAGNLSEAGAWKKVIGQIAAEDAENFMLEGAVGAMLGTDVYMYNKIFGKNEGISGTEQAATGKDVTQKEIATKEIKEGTSRQPVEQAEDSRHNTTNRKETLEEVGEMEDNDGIESGSKANLLDDEGKFTDDTLENNYQAYVNRKIKKGQTSKDRLEWKKASDYWTKESPVARGNNFNKTVREADIYDYHEVYLENGKRLDSYDPDAGEIISRKATDLDKITEETYRGYLSEFSQKYSEGTKIRSNAYPELDGQELKGQYILEIPASNADISNIDYYKQIADEYDVILRFTEEVQ